MPWKIEHTERGKWVVMKEGGAAVAGGEHMTEEEARKHMAALYASEKKADGSTQVRRFDVLERLDAPTLLPNGWLKADAWIARTGIQDYRRADGTIRRELRRPEQVFHPDALASFQMVPVTDDHPADGLLDASNASRYQRGHLGETVRRDGERVRATVLITDGALVQKVLGGKTQLSCGYACELDETPGEYEGQRYDAVQIAPRGNHVAVVAVGRAGPEVRLKLDTGDAVSIRGDRDDSPGPGDDGREEIKTMTVKLKIDGIEVEFANEQGAQLVERALRARDDRAEVADKALAEAVKTAKQAKADADAAAATAKSELEAQRARADVAEGKVKEVEKARTDAAAALPALVKARVALEAKAREVLGAEAKFDDKTDQQIKAAVIEKLSPSTKLDGKGADYIDPAYTAVLDMASSEALAAVRAAAKPAPGSSPAARVDANESRRKMLEAQEKAWQPAEAAK